MDRSFEVTIKEKVLNGDFKMSEHATKEAVKDRLAVSDIIEALVNGEMIEYYPAGRLGDSCLILGFSNNRPTHVICGIIGEHSFVTIRTVYSPPDMRYWMEDFKTRRSER